MTDGCPPIQEAIIRVVQGPSPTRLQHLLGVGPVLVVDDSFGVLVISAAAAGGLRGAPDPRCVSCTDCKAVASMLKPIFTGPDEGAALMAPAAFVDPRLGKKYPAALATWENGWDRCTAFLAFAPALHKASTHQLESSR